MTMLLLLILAVQVVMLLLSGIPGVIALAVAGILTAMIFAATFERGGGKYIKPDKELAWLSEGIKMEARRAGIKTPRLYLLDDYIPNAYSYGNTVVLSLGLFEILDREGILAVVAHEIGHIRNHDAFIFPFIAYGRAFMLLSSFAIVFVHASPYFIPLSFALLFLYEWGRSRFIRSREFKADAVAVSILDRPMSLKEALEELEYYDDLMAKVKRHALPGIEPSVKRDEKNNRQYWIPSVLSFPTHPSYSERIMNITSLVESSMVR